MIILYKNEGEVVNKSVTLQGSLNLQPSKSAGEAK